MAALTEKIYCAFCKLQRKVYKTKHLTWTNVLLAFGMSLVLMYGLWQQMDGRVTLIFAINIIVGEIFVYMRWRLSMKCPHCHFDPLLYKSNRPKLVRQVRERLDELRVSGGYLLRHNNPFEHLPTRPPTENEKQQEETAGLRRSREHLISKQV